LKHNFHFHRANGQKRAEYPHGAAKAAHMVCLKACLAQKAKL
jgi:hypothetical protein